MTDTPKRIWAAISAYTGRTMWWPDENGGGTEYIRADVVDAIVEALEEMIRQYDDLEIQGGEPSAMTLAYNHAFSALTKARGEV